MPTIQSVDPRTGIAFGEPLFESSPADVDRSASGAMEAFDQGALASAGVRAALLRRLADALESRRDALVSLGDRETALGTARLNGELDRTAFQLRAFGQLVADGVPFRVVDDPAVAGAPPAGHPAMLRVRIPVGPVAMFAASNFPFAFSVLGGDTASALAAGCTVVIKAHPAHPQLSRATFMAARDVLAGLGLDARALTMVEGATHAIGHRLVRHAGIAAVAFTGSVRGGLALQAEVQARPRPIPFYGELGSLNPLVALPAELAERGAALAKTLAGSITLGCGQFCTKPGLLIAFGDPASQAFLDMLARELAAIVPHPMLHGAIRQAFDVGVGRLGGHPRVRTLLRPGGTTAAPTPALFETTAATFVADPSLHEEVFGPACLVVRVAAMAEVIDVLNALGGALAVTLWGVDHEDPSTIRLTRAAMRIAGRVLFDGVSTGVAVTAAQQHGGPFPSSTQPFSTSVGAAAIDRFLRPVALQQAPQWLTARQGRPI